MALALSLFETDVGNTDTLVDVLLELGALSVTTEDADADTADEQPVFDEPGEAAIWRRTRLRVLLPGELDPRTLVNNACARAGIGEPGEVQVEAVPECDWVRQTQAQFDPIRISERLWIVPSWHASPAPPAITISLDPGVAFGTGSHPTTRLCLHWLERQVCGGETMLDYGCGSGILAITAMKLGAARAVGVDIDPAAVGAAMENARRNHVPCEFSDSRTPLAIEAHLIVANILANPLKLLAPLLARCALPGGRIALSGILEHQQGEIEQSYAPWFEFAAPSREEGWICLPAVRKVRSP